MATQAKRTTKSSKTAAKTTKRKTAASTQAATSTKKTAPKPKVSSSRTKKTSSKSLEFWKRTPFLFYAILVAAFLVAITLGLMTYQARKASTGYPVSATDTTGVLFLQSLDSDSSYKTGDTLEVKLYEDSGKQAVNALQAAVKYPAEQLELTDVQTDTAFSQVAATDTATAGLVRVARSIKPGESSRKGAKPVVTLQFKVLKDSDTKFTFTIDDASSLLVRSSDNQNILGSGGVTQFEL